MDLAPTTRAIVPTGRIRVTVGGQNLDELVAWSPGPLSTRRDGPWVVFRPDPSGQASHRNDGRCTYLDDHRLRLTCAVTETLGLRFGDEVALLIVPAQNAVVLTHPSRLLLGAPFTLLDPVSSTAQASVR